MSLDRMSDDRDDPRCEMTNRARGRVAFWNGSEIYSNPFTEGQAADWRSGWHDGDAAFRAAGGTTRTPDALQRLRPRDLPTPRRRTTISSRAAGQASADSWRRTISDGHRKTRRSA